LETATHPCRRRREHRRQPPRTSLPSLSTGNPAIASATQRGIPEHSWALTRLETCSGCLRVPGRVLDGRDVTRGAGAHPTRGVLRLVKGFRGEKVSPPFRRPPGPRGGGRGASP
jgi:hypothetical protein